MTNTPDRASPLASPFYSGNTTFGGANAAGLYKRGRNLFNSSNEVCVTNLNYCSLTTFNIIYGILIVTNFRFNFKFLKEQVLK